MTAKAFQIESAGRCRVLRLHSQDGTNRLTHACVLELRLAISDLACEPQPLVITGNQKFFSAGADLAEIADLTSPQAYEFAKMGQELMNKLQHFPAPVYAAIEGYCMGGGLDQALSCHLRVASSHAIFGHRGAALGLITGWGGTQRLPRLIGKTKALEMFICAEKINAGQALDIGLIDTLRPDPVDFCVSRCSIG